MPPMVDKAHSITLISPATNYDLELRNGKSNAQLLSFQRMPRMGLLMLEALTSPEWEVQLLDERVDVVAPQTIKSSLIGISVMTNTAPRAFELARQFKSLGKTVVFGGYFPSLSPGLALADPHVDSIVIGGADNVWPALLEDYKRGQLRRQYQNASKEKNFRLPPINYNLLGPDKGYNGHITQIQSTLGCKFSCQFCAIPQFYGGRFMLRDMDDLIEEITCAPTRRIAFIDDNLLNSSAYLDELCEKIAPLDKLWSAQVSMDIRGNQKLIKKMARAGCYWVHLGVESLDKATLQEQKKKQNDVNKYLDTFRMFRDEGISVSTGIILGFPNESPSVFDNTQEFLDRAWLDAVSFHYYTCYPGYPEYRQLQERGQLITEDLSHYDTYHPIIRTKHFTAEKLVENVEALKKHFYKPLQIISRAGHGLFNSYSGVGRIVMGGALGYLNSRRGLPIYL
jgi:radical SAM superfamily enzyme YgiQ (UPF0313 family)